MMYRTISTLLTVLLALSEARTSAHGLKLPFERRAPRGANMRSPRVATRYSFSASTQKEDITNIGDIRYIANITINGVVVPVVLDTGSTDLWVIPPGGIGAFNGTGIPLELLYGDGTYGVSGTIGISPFSFGTYSIARQAFMNARTSTILGMQELGVYGIFGLSFDFGFASPINTKIQSLYGNEATWGASVLKNIFEQHPEQPNFVALELGRSEDLEDTDGGEFTIGEYAPEHAVVANATKLAQYPKGGNRWTTLLEGVYVEGEAIAVGSDIPGVPAGHAQVLLDTGDPSAILPTATANAIYSRVPGAALYEAPTGEHMWIVPCNTTTLVELSFAGQRYPIHPLDLTTLTDPIEVNGQERIACVGALKGVDAWGGNEYDMSLGDSFLRNVYSVFDFGDPLPDGSTGEPYMQLLSLVDPTEAVSEVATIRGKTLATLPPEIDPATLVRILTGTDAPSPSGTSGAPPIEPTDGSSPESKAKEKPILGVSSPSVGEEGVGLAVDGETFKKYALAAILLLAANIVIGLVLIVFAVLGCMRRGSAASRKSSVRAVAPQYAPVKLEEEGYSGHYQQGYKH
ncbi:unnamed protein product [Cyclocybe aegerita]|uniref:Peptidase A1 domain-containing protein n=1 Tax=Cyclocybe aegerita TaxID=1973307 RepID=A0A8S0XIM7_CYCAE|nr:unnamed protein product [Cyclocybe aegerita]